MPLYGALTNPIYMPATRDITNITNATKAEVTTSFDHGYLTGLIVRLYIPHYFGMEQSNRLKGSIVVTSPTTFTIDIDTTSFDPFVIPPLQPGSVWTGPQVVPIGEDTDVLDSSFRNTLTPLF